LNWNEVTILSKPIGQTTKAGRSVKIVFVHAPTTLFRNEWFLPRDNQDENLIQIVALQVPAFKEDFEWNR
jgi:hypothetical protein